MLFLSEILVQDISLIKNLSFSFKLPLFLRNDFIWVGESPIFFKYEIFFNTHDYVEVKVDEFYISQPLDKTSIYFKDVLNQQYLKEIIYEYPVYDVHSFLNKLSHLSKIKVPYYIKISTYLNDFEQIIISDFFQTNIDYYFDYINHIFCDYNFQANFNIGKEICSTNKRKYDDEDIFDIDNELICPTKKILLDKDSRAHMQLI